MRIAALVCCALACVASAQEAATEPPHMAPAAHKHHRSSPFSQINKYLTENVKSDDVEANMAKAKEWLASAPSAQPPVKQSVVEALKVFTQLHDVLGGEDKCNSDELAILIKSDELARGRALVPPSRLSPLRRIDKIINHYYVQHAQNCRKFYPQIVANKVAKIDADTLARIDAFTSKIVAEQRERTIVKHNLAESQKTAVTFGMYFRTIGEPSNARVVYDVLVELVKDDPERDNLQKNLVEAHENNRPGSVVIAATKRPVNKAKIDELFKRYLVTPCRAFVRELADDLMSASFDMKVLEKADKFDLSQAEFYKTWSKYHICELLVKRDQRTLLRYVTRHIAG